LILGIAGFVTVLIPTVPIIVGVVTWAVAGLAMGLSYSTLSLLTLRQAPPEEQGSATAALQLSDVLGTSLGTGLGGALVVAGSPPGGGRWPRLPGAVAASGGRALAGVRPPPRFRRARRAGRAPDAAGAARRARTPRRAR